MKLTPEKIEACAQWVRENGLTDYGGASISKFCKAQDIDKQTYYNWLKGNSEFSTAIKEAQEVFKNNLERDLVVSLAKTAKGYSYTKTRYEYKNKDGYKVIAKQTEETIDVQPNVGAAIFLLTNINPERWKNKVSNDVNANVKSEVEADVSYDFEDVPDEMLFALADKMQEAQYKRKKAEKE